MAGFFAHPQAIVETSNVGHGTRIWAFAHVLPGAVIGEDCNLCDHTFVENDVVIGDRVTVKSGVQLWDGVRLEDDVFIGPNATFTNDKHPRSKQYPEEFLRTVVKRGASIGANATILPGVVIGQQAMVGAGAVVTRSVPAHAVVMGNPARIIRYVSTPGAGTAPGARPETIGGVVRSRVNGVVLERRAIVKDLRGNLSARQVGAGLPFVPQRYFVVTDVPSKEVRGEHAHRTCEQLLVCLRGSVQCVVDDGTTREEFALDSPELSLYLPPMVWGIQYRYSSAEATLLVLASHAYDPSDYIRDYEVFLAERRAFEARRATAAGEGDRG